jgi:hypothetical protein
MNPFSYTRSTLSFYTTRGAPDSGRIRAEAIAQLSSLPLMHQKHALAITRQDALAGHRKGIDEVLVRCERVEWCEAVAGFEDLFRV